MKYLKFLVPIMFLFFISCNDVKDGEDGKTIYITVDDSTDDIDTSTTDATTDTSETSYVLLSSVAEKGPCLKGSAVLAFPLFYNFIQTGSHFLGETKTDLGYWEVPARISEELTETKLEGLCYSELDGSTGIQKLGAIFFTASQDRNINPLTTIAVDVIRWVSGNQTIPNKYQAIIEAETLVSNVFGLGNMAPFSSISLNDGNLDAAKLALASSAILKARSNQTDLMVEIAQAIKAEDTTAIESEILVALNSLKILDISNNLKTKYESLNQVWVYPPMHIVAGLPDYYEDLLNRTPILQKTLNLSGDNSCGFGMGGINWYAIPYIFSDALSTSKYIGLNLQGDYLSIYSNKFDVYDLPDTEIFSIENLRENFFTGTFQDTTGDSFSGLPSNYTGLIENSGITPGNKIWFVVHKDTAYSLSKSCVGDLVPFGRVLFGIDGINWTGMLDNTAWFRRLGLKLFLTD